LLRGIWFNQRQRFGDFHQLAQHPIQGVGLRVPERVLPDVFRRLARVANAEGKLPPRATYPAPVYGNLALVLEQLGPPISQEPNG
jgi:hypothetical protein